MEHSSLESALLRLDKMEQDHRDESDDLEARSDDGSWTLMRKRLKRDDQAARAPPAAVAAAASLVESPKTVEDAPIVPDEPTPAPAPAQPATVGPRHPVNWLWRTAPPELVKFSDEHLQWLNDEDRRYEEACKAEGERIARARQPWTLETGPDGQATFSFEVEYVEPDPEVQEANRRTLEEFDAAWDNGISMWDRPPRTVTPPPLSPPPAARAKRPLQSSSMPEIAGPSGPAEDPKRRKTDEATVKPLERSVSGPVASTSKAGGRGKKAEPAVPDAIWLVPGLPHLSTAGGVPKAIRDANKLYKRFKTWADFFAFYTTRAAPIGPEYASQVLAGVRILIVATAVTANIDTIPSHTIERIHRAWAAGAHLETAYVPGQTTHVVALPKLKKGATGSTVDLNWNEVVRLVGAEAVADMNARLDSGGRSLVHVVTFNWLLQNFAGDVLDKSERSCEVAGRPLPASTMAPKPVAGPSKPKPSMAEPDFGVFGQAGSRPKMRYKAGPGQIVEPPTHMGFDLMEDSQTTHSSQSSHPRAATPPRPSISTAPTIVVEPASSQIEEKSSMIEDSDLSLDRLPGHLRPPGPAPPAAPKPSKGKGKARENVPPLSFGASTSAGPSAAAPSTVDPYADLREHIEDAEFEADFGLDPDAEAKPDELVIFEQDEQSDSQEEEEEFARTGIRPDRASKLPTKGKGSWACSKSSTLDDAVSVNQDIIDVLAKLAKWHEAQPGSLNHFKVGGYRKSMGALRNLNERITVRTPLKHLVGIGAKTELKILKTGKLRRLESMTEEDKVAEQLRKCHGIGSSTARAFFNAGVRSIADLHTPEKYNITLNTNQKLGLEHFDDLLDRMPRAEAQAIHELVAELGRRVDKRAIFTIMGSYRRGQKDCGDVDILVSRPTADGRDHRGVIKHTMQKLVKDARCEVKTLTAPDDWNALDASWHGLIKLAAFPRWRRLDLLGVPEPEMGATLIYFTFNRSLRLKARKMGLSLNQRGLFENVIRDPKTGLKTADGIRLPLNTEEAIFERLGVAWRPPTERLPGAHRS